jgi:hypothetical protein
MQWLLQVETFSYENILITAFFFEHGSRFHYSSTGAKSLATNTWIQAGIESLTEYMSETRLAPKLAKACATELHDRELMHP